MINYTETDWQKYQRHQKRMERLKAIEERLNAEIERIQQVIKEDRHERASLIDYQIDLEMLEGIRDGNK